MSLSGLLAGVFICAVWFVVAAVAVPLVVSSFPVVEYLLKPFNALTPSRWSKNGKTDFE